VFEAGSHFFWVRVIREGFSPALTHVAGTEVVCFGAASFLLLRDGLKPKAWI